MTATAAPTRDRYAVIGNPIAHSKSPAIHAMFAEQTGEPVEYGRMHAPLDGFVDAVHEFIAAGGRGMNVTVPFKLEAHALATTLSPRADAAGAVNTLRFDRAADGGLAIFGDNTDGVGLVRDIEDNLKTPLAGARVLLLGAGGASRGVILPLLERGPCALTIINRTASRAGELVERFADAARTAHCELAGGAPGAERGVYDVVINATAGSLDAAIPEFGAASMGPDTLAYDMMYAAEPTVFMRHAAASFGARTADGLGMLVGQAAESFFVWRGVRPDPAPVLASLRASLRPSF
jgi:shikimate dehydrogenase